jgi:hypothetical protein
MRVIYPAFRLLFPNQVIRADDLGRAMVDITMNAPSEHMNTVFENSDIQKMVGLLPPTQ